MFKSRPKLAAVSRRPGNKLAQLRLLDQPDQASSNTSNCNNKQDFFNQNCHRIYSCIHCRAHLANHDELISKLFQGNHGRAYLFNKVVNIGCKQAVQRELLTGLHAVADIYCDNCDTTLGWKYEQAFVASQKYKEGKYIIELVHMLKENTWDPSSYNARDLLNQDGLTTGAQASSLSPPAGLIGPPASCQSAGDPTTSSSRQIQLQDTSCLG